jgi:tRNA pseudouridine55 synthase
VGTRRVGHAGTLDPFASGLLTVLVGRATRLAPFLVGLPKRYTGTIRLGVVTDTDDRDGTVVREDQAHGEIGDDALAAAMMGLTGPVLQRPPAYSAKKVGGVPAHRRVRRGETVSLAPHEVVIHRFDLTSRSGPAVRFEAEVSSGTYIRALARDLGDALGCGAHLAALRRTAVGPWTEDDALPLAELATPVPLRPAREAVGHLPQHHLAPADAVAVRHGRAVPGAAEAGADAPVALLDGETLLAIARPQDALLHPTVVLAS